MTRRVLQIGRWYVEFYFSSDSYNEEYILERLYDFGASATTLREAEALLEEGAPNKAFTFTNPYDRVALVFTTPTTSGGEFLDSFVHEIRHLANEIALGIGVRLDAETPSYIAGDTARELIDVVCELGCKHCNG